MLLSFVTMFLLSLASSGQEKLINNFFVEDKSLYWQITVESNLSYKDILQIVKELGYFESIDTAGSKIICAFKPYQIDTNKFGYKRLSTPTMFRTCNIVATIIFETKDGRYRVTAKNINFIALSTNAFERKGEIISLESYVFKKNGQLSSNEYAYDKPTDIFNLEFSKYFTFKKNKNDENW